MRVVPRTLLGLAGTAVVAAVMIVPASAGGIPVADTAASVVPLRDIRLVASIHAVSLTPGEVRYVVTVRPVGGPAQDTRLSVATRGPATWAVPASGCQVSPDETALDCGLGDVSESGSRTLRLSVRPGARGAVDVSVIAQATAANVRYPAIASSLASIRPGAVPPVRSPDGQSPADEPPGAESLPVQPPAGEATTDTPPGGEPLPAQPPAAQSSDAQSPEAHSPEAQTPVGQSPPAQSSGGEPPAVQSPATQSPQLPSPLVQSPAVRSHAVRPPAGRAPAVRGQAGRPPAVRNTPPRPGGPVKEAHPVGPRRPAGASRPGAQAGAPSRVTRTPNPAPHAAPHAGPRARAVPRAPAVPQVPGAPPAPMAPPAPPAPAGPAAPPLPIAPSVPFGGPGAPPIGPPALAGPGAAPIAPGGASPPTLPQIAPPQPSPSPSPSEGISELTTLAPAGALRAGRTSWATVIAVAIAAEAGLLWLFAGLTVWRRRRVRQGCVWPSRPPWLRIPKLLR